MKDDETTPAEHSAFAGDTPPHVDSDQETGVSDDALDTEELAEGGPAGA